MPIDGNFFVSTSMLISYIVQDTYHLERAFLVNVSNEALIIISNEVMKHLLLYLWIYYFCTYLGYITNLCYTSSGIMTTGPHIDATFLLLNDQI